MAADIAILEHPWNSVAGRAILPERIVIDLDHEPGQTWTQVIAAAEGVRDRMAEVGLTAWLKTSGGRGVHVVAPFAEDPERPTTWAQAKAFGERLCGQMAADSPQKYTVALTKAQGGDRILLDYLRNDPGHHAMSLLSPHPPRRTGLDAGELARRREARPAAVHDLERSRAAQAE